MPNAPEAIVASGMSRALNPLDERATMHAWEDFLAGRDAPRIRAVVADSWRRSFAVGVDARGGGTPASVRDDDFWRVRVANRNLLAAASPVLAQAADMMTGTSAMMLLTCPKGIVLDQAGDRRVIEKGRDIQLEAGGNWSEDCAGTNGIGTALATRQPVLVHAAEHFREGIKSWSCAGAPVQDPIDGSILGVVDISGPQATFQRQNMALAIAIARQIERALEAQDERDRLRLLEACLDEVRGWSDDLVVLDRRGRIVHVRGFGEPGEPRLNAIDLSPGTRLLRDDATLEHADWMRHLPADVRPDWLRVLHVGDQLMGALIAVPQAKRSVPTKDTRLHEGDAARESFAAIIGESPAIVAMKSKAERLARHRAAVLIQGETGVGKELVARAVHGAHAPGQRPFVVVNCGAFTREMLASELFGYVKGAFTGAALEGRAGRFELAHGGTLCLDEIGELPLDLQPYLLRALEEGVVYRLGDHQPRRVDVRLIAVTNRHLPDEVEAGRFRRDLYYRISTTTITVPPLRERVGDVALLARHFNCCLAREHGVEPSHFGPAVLAAFESYDWPGNVRELRNVVHSLLLTRSSPDVDIQDIDLPSQRAQNAAAGDGLDLHALERERIEATLRQHAGLPITRLARLLGISRSTLYRKAKEYGITI
ncbi:Transcriptional regulator of acetoin/glycerol metabolism [Arboricoccus pini]|uniref:Transcriptional regulator of acetoin/glycerol metabolism n=1 Tax=Arboricoccus pini TaxID=1963835 RepID=A0A212RG62_9PROT|nr:sigma-54-dependent Fis family transcriptional regulator [Arboricoccus pini]SNB71361.1 Transcriptional regulator of acetoin/glycerol metabolism [Arboricoccus pini]